MSFGKKAPKSDKPKKVSVKAIKDKEIRDGLIVDRIKGIVECTDIGCCPIDYIHNKIPNINKIESYIKRCVQKNGYILHRGWIYNKLWTIEDLNEICNDKVIINDFADDNSKIDKNVLDKLTTLYKRENEPIKISWFEMLISHGILHITEEQLYQSTERLMRSGKIYEPRIGEFAPTYDSIY